MDSLGAKEQTGPKNDSGYCETFLPIFGTVTPDFVTILGRPPSPLIFLVRACGDGATTNSLCSSSNHSSESNGRSHSSGSSGGNRAGDESQGPSVKCGGMGCGGRECEGLEALVSDFCGSSWRTRLSRDDLEDEKDDLGVGGSFADFLALIHESLSSRHVTVAPALARARPNQAPRPASHSPALDTITLTGQKAEGAPRIRFKLKRVDWPGRDAGGGKGRTDGGVEQPSASHSHSLLSHPLQSSSLEAIGSATSPASSPLFPSCESVAAEIAFALVRDRLQLEKTLRRERAKHVRQMAEVEKEKDASRSYGILGPPKSKLARSRSASRMTGSHVAPAPSHSLSHSQSMSRSQGHAPSQKHPRAASASALPSGAPSASAPASVIAVPRASAWDTAGTAIARSGSGQGQDSQQSQQGHQGQQGQQQLGSMSQDPSLLSQGGSQGWLVESQGTTEDTAAQMASLQSHPVLSQLDSQSQPFLSQSEPVIPHAFSRTGGERGGGEGMMGAGGREEDTGRRAEGSLVGSGGRPGGAVGGAAGGAAGGGVASAMMARDGAASQGRLQQRRQPVPYSRRVKRRTLGTKLTTDGDDDEDDI
ncbi:unnamed protein product [Closterium sp. NIES-53]